jgi:hypothetical protein
MDEIIYIYIYKAIKKKQRKDRTQMYYLILQHSTIKTQSHWSLMHLTIHYA